VDVTAVRQAIATNLAPLASTGGMNKVAWYMFSNPEPPCLHIFPAAIAYDAAMKRGLDRNTFTVQALVALTSETDGQTRLDTYLASSGAASVKALVESDKTLGGLVHDTHVTRNTGYKVFVVPGRSDMLGCEWTVEVIAPG